MIHVQRPDATACAEYRLWSEKMNRHVRYGAKGIAIISEAGGTPVLRYVFDVSDTRPRANARTPYLWQYREEHQDTVAKMLEDCFQVPADKGVSFQLATVAAQFSEKYWKSYQKEILGAVQNTLLQKYDEADAASAVREPAPEAAPAPREEARQEAQEIPQVGPTPVEPIQLDKLFTYLSQ